MLRSAGLGRGPVDFRERAHVGKLRQHGFVVADQEEGGSLFAAGFSDQGQGFGSVPAVEVSGGFVGQD